MSLIYQLTSEDIKHHFIIMWTVGEDAVCIVGRSATKVISEDLGSCGRGGSPQDVMLPLLLLLSLLVSLLQSQQGRGTVVSLLAFLLPLQSVFEEEVQ